MAASPITYARNEQERSRAAETSTSSPTSTHMHIRTLIGRMCAYILRILAHAHAHVLPNPHVPRLDPSVILDTRVGQVCDIIHFR